jgi:hypothetical protein
MARKVKWGRPTRDKYGDAVRVSKCGRFRVLTMPMASGRNGYWNARAYDAQRADGTRIGKRVHDTLIEALDACEFENDPTWEPS